MNIIVEDYSSVHYEVLEKMAIPSSRGGKFVQIRNNDSNEYIVLSPTGLSKYHANIVERFCHMKRRNISFRYNPQKDDCQILDSDWEIIGGGFWRVEGTYLSLYGKSKAYGSFERYPSLAQKIKEQTGFSKIIIK